MVSPADGSPLGVGRSVRLSRLSDELLARYAARGSEHAFAVLYGRYHQPLYGYCRSIVRNDADAQDALQSTFAGALAALQRRQRNAPLRPWLFRIAHNEAISLIRRRSRDTELGLAESGLQVAPSAEDQAAALARWALLTADLAELPERLKSALLLRELSGLSHEEIATTLGTTVGGAKQAIFEARQSLAEFAEGRAMVCEQVRRRISEGDGRVLRGRLIRAHLRDCAACGQFAASIPARRAELRAFAPALAPGAAAAVFSHAIGAISGHGGAAASSATAASAAAAAGTAGKTAAAMVAWKTAATGAVVLVTTAAGVVGLTHVLRQHQPGRPAAAPTRPAGRSGPGIQPGRAASNTPPHASTALPARGVQVKGLHATLPGGPGAQRHANGGRAATTGMNTAGRKANGRSAEHAAGSRSMGAGTFAVHRRSGSHVSATRGRSTNRRGIPPRSSGIAGRGRAAKIVQKPTVTPPTRPPSRSHPQPQKPITPRRPVASGLPTTSVHARTSPGASKK